MLKSVEHTKQEHNSSLNYTVHPTM